eukprot:gnl/Dysnectes_brevis/931_a1036_4039.p1 GENE.gnl/Dysnectes_brevis/931_a1036_4039~~gnl/Dysnectes_brevis/931_a1036_4039.p1  ORF type:complete len:562 (-),score=196.17 gnl/Dysnectes_brevis/931_a1036_4039:32-1717(-)
MSQTLETLPSPIKRGPVVLCIIDGYGIQSSKMNPEGDAIRVANPKNIDAMIAKAKADGNYTELFAHGTHVGLPSDKDMGNSEVGHNAIGCGQIVAQGAQLVNQSIESGAIFEADAWKSTVTAAIQDNKTVHFFGLLSDGGVHSHEEQLFSLMNAAVSQGAKRIRVHPLLDGRDVHPTSGLQFIGNLEAALGELRGKGIDARIGSGAGRMVCTMDRYEGEWEMVMKGWNQMVHGVVVEEELVGDYIGYYTSSEEAIKHARSLFPSKQDQFNPPWVVVDESGDPIGRIEDGDAVINFNFRGDRALEISRAFDEGAEFVQFERSIPTHSRPKARYAGMLEYDSEAHIPETFLLPPPSISHVMLEYLCEAGKRSYAIAETHKFGHVGYFFVGNRSGYFDPALELSVEVPSEPTSMIESHPEMRCKEVTDALLEQVTSGNWDFLRVNYANPDMVGHTGNMESVVRCVKALDIEIERLREAVASVGGVLCITADHGNAEELLDTKGNTKTSHSLGKVPFAIYDPAFKGEYHMVPVERAGLTNVASTLLMLMGFAPPSIYRPSLIKME